MSLTPEQVRQIADLARLALDDGQLERLVGDLSHILDMVDQLQQAEVDGLEPMAHPLDMNQRLRPDEVTETNQREVFQSIAPEVEGGLYKVPKVIE